MAVRQTAGMDVDTVPTRYLVGCGMDEKEAARRWRITWEWRNEKDIDNLLNHPMPHCDKFKSVWTHHFHRRARKNFMDPDKPGKTVWYDQINPSGMAEMTKHASLEDMEQYYYYLFEFAYAHLETEDPGGRLVNVYDLSKLSMSALMGKGGDFGKRMMKGCNLHYPERADRVFILNAPRFFTYLWGIVSVFVDPRTQAKINVTSSSSMPAMLEYIGADRVPRCYGGTDDCDLGEAPEEQAFRNFVRRRLAEGQGVHAGGEEGGGGGTPKKEMLDLGAGGEVADGGDGFDPNLVSAAKKPGRKRIKPASPRSSSSFSASSGRHEEDSFNAYFVAFTGLVAAIVSVASSGRLAWLWAIVAWLPVELDESWLQPCHPSVTGFWMGVYLGSGLILLSRR